MRARLLSGRSRWLLIVPYAFLVALILQNLSAPVSVGTQYQSYRLAITSADAFVRTGALLAVPRNTEPRTYYSFERLTKDDVGYPIVLSVALAAGLIALPEASVEELREANIEESRALMAQSFVPQTFTLGYGFYYLCLLCFATALLGRTKDEWSVLLVALLTFAPYLIRPVFDQIAHSHSLIPGLCILALTIPLLFGPGDEPRWRFFAKMGLLALILIVIFLGRKSTGYMAAGATAGAALVFYMPLWRKAVALAAIVGAYVMCMVLISAVDHHRSGVVEMEPLPEHGATFGHPIYHALLFGLGRDDNALGIATEADVVAAVRERAGDPDLVVDTRRYIDVAKDLYWSYVWSNPDAAASFYARQFALSVERAAGQIGLGILAVVVISATLVAAGFALARTRKATVLERQFLYLAGFGLLSAYTGTLVSLSMLHELIMALLFMTFLLLAVATAAMARSRAPES